MFSLPCLGLVHYLNWFSPGSVKKSNENLIQSALGTSVRAFSIVKEVCCRLSQKVDGQLEPDDDLFIYLPEALHQLQKIFLIFFHINFLIRNVCDSSGACKIIWVRCLVRRRYVTVRSRLS